GADIALIDVQKKGADFEFAKDRMVGFAKTVPEAAALMKAIYAEVHRRAELNAEYGAGSARDLPEGVRPNTLLVFIDEFLGVIMAGKKPSTQAEDDPEREAQRQEKIAMYNARKDIGFLAGRIAAEARSADVHLVLMTQRLIAAMLDDDLKDLKDLALDTRIPVPVSEKFPTGWATNAELEIGDQLYTASGGTVPVVGFSEEFADNEMYAITFDDGQVVRAGAEHLWTVSDYNSRRQRTSAGFDEPGADRLARADIADLLAATVPVGTWAEPREIANMVGYSTVASVVSLADAFGLDRMIRLASGRLRIADRRPKGGSAPRVFEVDAALSILSESSAAELVGKLEADGAGDWLSAREIAIAMWGPSASVGRILAVRELLTKSGCPAIAGGRESVMFEVPEFCAALSRHLRLGPDATAFTGHLPPIERVLSTREIADRVKVGAGQSNWAIRLPVPIDPPDEDLAVDPYTLGAWLGDGSTGAAMIISSAGESCTDSRGLTDQAHMIEQLRSAGYQPHVLPCHSDLLGTYGLYVQLREIGVLTRKHIPVRYLRASFQQRLALLQGLMDTDGSLMANGQCSLPQTNKHLADGAMELIQSLGVKAHWSSWDGHYIDADQKRHETDKVWHISFRTSLPAFRLPRKLEKQVTPKERRRSSQRYIRSIERIASVPSRCIAVDSPDHLFLVEGFIPTHNTNMARILLGKTNQGERMSALRDPENAPPLGDPVPKGRGIWESTLDAAKLAQFWFATPDVYRRELESRRPAVNAVDKIDLAPFMPKLPDPGDVAGSIIPSTGSTQDPDAVVELGEFTLDLMDLDDLDDEDEIEPSDTADDPTEPFMAGPADTEPGPVEYEVRDERRDAVLLLDVDGVLSPLGGPPSPRWQDWRSVDGFAAGSMAASGEMTGALCRLGAPMAWLTSWTDEAPLAFAGMMPEQMPILCRGASEYGWWKLDALAGYLDEHTDIRRIVWADDELNGEDDLGLPFSDIATELLDEHGVAGLLLCPSADEGLSPDHLAEIDSWLDGETAQSERRETDAGENSPAEDALTQPVAEDRAEQQNSPAPNTIAWDAPLEEVCPADDPVSDRPAVDPTAGDGAVEDGGSEPGLDAAPAARDEFAAPTVKPKFVPSGPDPFV
ncbi:MAG: hypothetical protein M3Y35_04745, partial [Actinomycetota bacterium]|nr:hypothetical protein [Actinomycetota bacterium]